MFMKTGVISHAKGSSYLEVGDTKVQVAVYGPREIPKRSDFSMKGILSCEMKYAPFACATRRGHQRDAEEIELGLLLKECLESTVRMNLYPKSRIDVFVTVLEDGGGVLAASITATGLALVDAQIDMYDNLIGCGISIHKDRLLVDPTLTEEVSCSDSGEGYGNLTVGYLNTSEQVVCLFSQGVLLPDDMDTALNLAINKCEEILPAVQECQITSLERKLSKMNQA
jgi:exosome complex component MTR3